MLPLRSIDRAYALEIVRYHTKRNFIAYESHRKKRVALAKFFNLQRMFQQKDNAKHGITHCFINLFLRSGNFFLVATFTFLHGNATGKLTLANLIRIAPKSLGWGIW